MLIVGMDPGRHLGICRALRGDKRGIVVGVNLATQRLRDTTDLGAFLKSADDPIRTALQGADLLAIEKPNTAGQHHAGMFKNIALYGLALYWAAHMGVRVLPVGVTQAKLAIADRGNAKKPEVIAAAEFWLGVPAGTLDEHQADALACYAFASFGAPPNAADRAKAASARKRAAKEAAKLKDSLL